VHAALSGISAAISDDGRVLAETPLYEEATLVFEMRPADIVTFYARTGEWFPMVCLVLAALGLLAGARTRPVGTVA
jgi:apolipoprotein N-acyltransferase